ncbi:MAG: hypothetical protein V7641_649 [Blastocatellia bacterium]
MCGTKSAFRVLHLPFPVNTPYRDFAGIFSPIAVIFEVRRKISSQSVLNRINIYIPHIFNKCSVAQRFQKSSPLFCSASSTVRNQATKCHFSRHMLQQPRPHRMCL